MFEKILNSTEERSHGKKITYTYDSTNRRVARTDETGTYQYFYGNPDRPFQLTAAREPSACLSIYHYDDLSLPYALHRDSKRYYIIADQLGTPELVCDENGEPIKTPS
jgi:YD repeat-containing protein